MRFTVRATLGAGISAVALLAAVPLATPAPAEPLPYTDAAAVGVLGLCNQAGQPIDHGSTADVPFVGTAVSSVPAPPPYNGAGATATLFAYQPRPGVPAGEWSGAQLTASSRYTDPDHPMAQATGGDGSLGDFVTAYPPRWDGLVQLRLYLGAPGQPTYSVKYAATDIKVSGQQWTVVRGGAVACDSGHATSVEQALLPPSFLTPTTTTPHPDAARSGARPTSVTSGTGTPSGGPVADRATMHFTVSGDRSNPGHRSLPALAGVVVVLAIGGWTWRRRRHPKPAPPS